MTLYVYKCFLCDEIVSYNYDDSLKSFETVSCERRTMGRGVCGGTAYRISKEEEEEK